jgi:oligoendopeptidase F
MTQTDTEQIRWDLGLMYLSPDDPRLDADIARLIKMAKDFNASYKGKLTQLLGKAILDYSEIVMLENKIALYLYLKQSTNVADPVIKARIAKTERILSQARGEYLTFFNIG